MSPEHDIHLNPVPRHIAVIMDGNGRWATARGLDRSAGHVAGVTTVRNITRAAGQAGVQYLTLYTFSTENWNRPAAEVEALMQLIVTAIRRETPDLIANNVRLNLIGDTGRIPAAALEELRDCISQTAGCTGLTLTLAISYSARWDLTQAAQAIARKAALGQLDPDTVTQDTVAAHLSTAGIPDPDLIIRTGGESRLSNYLLWEAAYAEIIIDDTYWPDYTPGHLADAIARYQRRQRRYGLTQDQITPNNNPTCD